MANRLYMHCIIVGMQVHAVDTEPIRKVVHEEMMSGAVQLAPAKSCQGALRLACNRQ